MLLWQATANKHRQVEQQLCILQQQHDELRQHNAAVQQQLATQQALPCCRCPDLDAQLAALHARHDVLSREHSSLLSRRAEQMEARAAKDAAEAAVQAQHEQDIRTSATRHAELEASHQRARQQLQTAAEQVAAGRSAEAQLQQQLRDVSDQLSALRSEQEKSLCRLSAAEKQVSQHEVTGSELQQQLSNSASRHSELQEQHRGTMQRLTVALQQLEVGRLALQPKKQRFRCLQADVVDMQAAIENSQRAMHCSCVNAAAVSRQWPGHASRRPSYSLMPTPINNVALLDVGGQRETWLHGAPNHQEKPW